MNAKEAEGYPLRKKIGLFSGIVIMVIILVMPAPEGMSISAKRTLAVTALMAIFWVTEAIPIAATALIPLPAYPLLGIMSAPQTSAPYANHNIFLFMGGLFIAMAMQRWNLHRRIAMNIISVVGEGPRRLVLGFMIATGFVSMWISDTVSAMMMMPIGLAVIVHFEDRLGGKDPKFIDNFATAIMLGIAYSAVIGGIGTLIGTPPNIVFAGMIKNLFPDCPDISFAQWMLVGTPITAVFLPIVWLYLTRLAAPLPPKGPGLGDNVVKKEIKKLGAWKRAEKYTFAVFCTAVFLWMFRQNIKIGNIIIPGWTSVLPWATGIKDATVAMTMGLLLFIIPVDFKNGDFVLNWTWAKKLPWHILILFGGGFALANGVKETGLALWVGEKIALFGHLPPLMLIISVCLMMTFLTEITSNTAITTIMMPILATTAVALGINPILLMVPAAISASCAFMLPVATPGNAIVFGSGYLTIPRMAKTGFALNFVGGIIITIVIYTVAIPVFGVVLGQIPLWAK